MAHVFYLSNRADLFFGIVNKLWRLVKTWPNLLALFAEGIVFFPFFSGGGMVGDLYGCVIFLGVI